MQSICIEILVEELSSCASLKKLLKFSMPVSSSHYLEDHVCVKHLAELLNAGSHE
jgi:hypothetical protein